MRSILRITVPVFLAMAASVAMMVPQQVTAEPVKAAQASESIRGRVVTATGEPISEALVSLVVAGRTDALVTTRTEADGSFELPAPSMSGAYAVRVLRIGYTPATVGLVTQNGSWKVPGQVVMQSITMTPVLGESASR